MLDVQRDGSFDVSIAVRLHDLDVLVVALRAVRPVVVGGRIHVDVQAHQVVETLVAIGDRLFAA